MRHLSTFLLVLSLSACMSYGNKVDQDKVSKFEKGKTTYAEVIQQLGKPTQSTINSDGTRTAIYTYMQSQANAVNFIPFVGIFAGGGTMENTTVMLRFDKNSHLIDYSATEGGSSMGTGIASGAKQ